MLRPLNFFQKPKKEQTLFLLLFIIPIDCLVYRSVDKAIQTFVLFLSMRLNYILSPFWSCQINSVI